MKEDVALDSLSLVNQGRLLNWYNEAMQEAQELFVNHVKKWGPDAKGAKVTVTMKVILTCEDSNGNAKIRAKVIATAPEDPELTSYAKVRKDRPEGILFVRPDGSSEDPPQQGVLTTRDGREVDLSTGEILCDDCQGDDPTEPPPLNVVRMSFTPLGQE